MKLTALFAAFFSLFAGFAFAGSTENITGCATVAVEGTNATIFVDPTCPAPAVDGGEGIADLVKEVFEDLAEQNQ